MLLTTARRPLHPLRRRRHCACSRARESTGVRGVRLAAGDEVISMAILRHVEAGPAERTVVSSAASAAARAAIGDADAAEADRRAEAAEIEAEEGRRRRGRLCRRSATSSWAPRSSSSSPSPTTATASAHSAYDYRLTGRGGQGLIAHNLTGRGGRLAASFPVEESDELLLVTDGGQLIRTRIEAIRIAARNTQGVTIFRTDGERVVSVERLEGEAGEDVAEE